MIGLSFCIGRYSISIGMLLKTLKGFIIGDLSDIPNNVITVLTKIRIPRILAAILIGGSLALSGSSYQALFKNPMVSPDILGASQGSFWSGTWIDIELFLYKSILDILSIWNNLC